MRFMGPAALVLAGLSAAFDAPAGASAPLDDATKVEVIERLHELLEDIYVIPSTAREISAELDRRLDAGEFADVRTGAEFAAAVTDVMQRISHDQHLRLSLPGAGPPANTGEPVRVVRRIVGGESTGDADASPAPRGGGGAVPAGLDRIEPFPKVEMLAGNVGLVEIRLFAARERAEAEAVRAMEKVAGADALIFDLRGCMGGTPDMVHLLTSYLYGPEPMHLLTYYHAHTDPDSAYTLAEVPGRRLPDADVYVLTSSFTASGGEEFTYNLKHHGRATVVGELTAGAGHGGGIHAVAAGFEAFVPDFRPVHPVTGTGWEAVGVRPDVEVDADAALAVAHREALRKQVARTRDAVELETLELEIARLDTEIERVGRAASFDPEALEEYAGGYGIRTITLDEKGLHLQRVGGPRLRLVPTGEPDEFRVKIVPDGIVRFLRGPTGDIQALKVLDLQGNWQRSERNARLGQHVGE